MNVANWKMKAVAAVAGVALIAGVGAGIAWWATSTSYRADIADLNAAHLKEKGRWDADRMAITTKAQQDTAAALQRTKDAQAAAAALDAEWQEKFANAQKENNDLRDDVAAGHRRVRILTANLTARQHSPGGSPGSSCVGDGQGAELTAEAGSTVLDIRAGIARREAKIDYLQGYIEKVVRQCKVVLD